ncbi:MAG TPA: hypothetical protein VFV66_26045 [Nonomuraea sp.]|nr:hypothetical protein [Nonomuraea sp.]
MSLNFRKARLGITLAATVTAVVALSPLPAQAAIFEKICPGGTIVTGSLACQVNYSGFPGGTISFDVEQTGSDTATQDIILASGGRIICRTTYKAVDPPRSWICNNVPRGSGTLTAAKRPYNVGRVAVRW